MSGGAAVEGLRETLRAFSKLDKDAQKAARDEVQKVANLLARELAQAGRATGDPRNRHVAQSIRGTRERTPVVKVGNAQRMAVSRAGRGPRASDLMFGMEFGSTNVATRGGDNATVRGGRPGWRFPERTPRARPSRTGDRRPSEPARRAVDQGHPRTHPGRKGRQRAADGRQPCRPWPSSVRPDVRHGVRVDERRNEGRG